MARTILQIAQEAAERRATAPAPTQLFGTNNKTAKILRIAALDIMRDYLRVSNFVGLSEFHSTWAFSLVPGRFAYPLPPDFLRMIPNTEHRGGWPMGLIGPATPQTWANWIFGGSAAPVEMGWRVRNGALFIDPTPKTYELVTIEYISRYPVVSVVREGDYDITQNPPVCTAPFVPRDGQMTIPKELNVTENLEDEGEYDEPGYDEAVFGQSTHEALRRIAPTTALAPLAQVRRPEFAADDDLPAFDDDYLLSIGMTFKLRQALGMDYAEEAAEYEREMEMKAGSDAGGPRSIRLGCQDGAADVVPLGDGLWMVG